VRITGAKQVSNDMLKTGRESIFETIKEENSRAFVVACGPPAMVNQVWDLSIKKGISKVRFDFHHETFEF
jgi:NAD(P)H-flavin reductase